MNGCSSLIPKENFLANSVVKIFLVKLCHADCSLDEYNNTRLKNFINFNLLENYFYYIEQKMSVFKKFLAFLQDKGGNCIWIITKWHFDCKFSTIIDI